MDTLSRLLGAARADGTSPTPGDWARAVVPLLAPLAIVAAGPRVDALAPLALTWMVLLVPGLLAVNLWFPQGHPLGAGVSRLGVASLLALVPFGLPAYAGCMLHWRLTVVIWLYAGLYIAIVGGLAWGLLRRGRTVRSEPPVEPFDLPLRVPRWMAVVVLVAIGVVLIGVGLSAPNTHVSDAEFSNPAARPGWWHGAVLGAVASLVAAVALAVALRRGRRDTAAAEVESEAKGRDAKGRTSRPKRVAAATFDWARLAVVPLWIACGGMALHFMRATYSVSVPKMEYVDRMLGWDVDDVAYVSEAVDDRYDVPMGRVDASVGGEYRMSRAHMTPLFAPLVAMIARVTGVGCAALHHSVMPPLVVLIGLSCYAAALMVAFRMHRWAVPLGLLVLMLFIFKSWDYARCEVEMLIYRSVQGKALHLWWPLPLQIASVVLLARRPGLRHLLFALTMAFVGHLTHPLATIMGMVMCTAVLIIVLIERRSALPVIAAMLIAYCGLAGEYKLSVKMNTDLPSLSSGRSAGDPLESRDLVRADLFEFSVGTEFGSDLESGEVTATLARAFREHDLNIPTGMEITHDETDGAYLIGGGKRGSFRIVPEGDRFDVIRVQSDPLPRHDPFWTFGCNTLYLAGSLAVPLLLALGLWRREWLYIGALGLAVLLATNLEPLGRILNVALPTAIFWRARWMVPTLLNMAAVAAVIWWAVQVLLRDREGCSDAGRAFVAALVAVGAAGLTVGLTDGRRVQVGAAPVELSKFGPEIHQLVGKLGGVEASPFVWGNFLVHHELPQLMPHLNLVFSRDKFMRPADDPQYRLIVLRAYKKYTENVVEPGVWNRLLELYPIDHIVVDHGFPRAATTLIKYLKERGWTLIGRTERRYEVWRAPEGAAPSADKP